MMKSLDMALLGLVLAATACTKPAAGTCETSTDCTNPNTPYCDIDGSLTGQKGLCTMMPDAPPIPDAPPVPIDAPTCTPAATRCMSDNLETCNGDGLTETETACPLGCGGATAHCLTFDADNGLGTTLGIGSTEPDVTIPDGTKFNTTNGVVTPPSGPALNIRSFLVPQGTSKIRAFVAKSFVIGAVRVQGDYAIAFLAPGAIQVTGIVDVSFNSNGGGVLGAQDNPNCNGISGQTSSTTMTVPGAGGAGMALVGGSGGDNSISNGGAVLATHPTLVGGCRGGSMGSNNAGGIGGGAIQASSLASIAFVGSGLINVGGGGGFETGAGGGSGGFVVLEAPTITFNASTTGVAANGGGGGACGVAGATGTPNTIPAASTQCSGPGTLNRPVGGGAGGTAAIPAASGAGCSSTLGCATTTYGGGGGGVGAATVRTRTGAFNVSNNPTLSVIVSLDTLATH